MLGHSISPEQHEARDPPDMILHQTVLSQLWPLNFSFPIDLSIEGLVDTPQRGDLYTWLSSRLALVCQGSAGRRGSPGEGKLLRGWILDREGWLLRGCYIPSAGNWGKRVPFPSSTQVTALCRCRWICRARCWKSKQLTGPHLPTSHRDTGWFQPLTCSSVPSPSHWW